MHNRVQTKTTKGQQHKGTKDQAKPKYKDYKNINIPTNKHNTCATQNIVKSIVYTKQKSHTIYVTKLPIHTKKK